MKMKSKTLTGALLLAVLVLIGVPAVSRIRAASYVTSSWISPTGTGWGNDTDLLLMNGWEYHANIRSVVFAYEIEGNLYAPVNVTYCIAPQVPRVRDLPLVMADSSFLDYFDSSRNDILNNAQIRELLSFVLYFGFSGNVRSQSGVIDPNNPTELKNFAEAIATQVLVWEVIVGERYPDFTHRTSTTRNSAIDFVKNDMPGYSYFRAKYDSIVSSVQRQLKTPSFLSASASGAARSEMLWTGSQYQLTLTDTNGVLADWSFSGDGLSFSKSGNTLTVSCTSAPSGDVLITASRTIMGKSPVVLAESDSVFNPQTASVQPSISPGETVSSSRQAYRRVYAAERPASLIIRKQSALPALTDGNRCYSLDSIRFGVYTDQACQTPALDWYGQTAVLTVRGQNEAVSEALELKAGEYWIKELSSGTGYATDSAPKAVNLTAGGTESVTFANTPLSDPIGLLLKKTDSKTGEEARRVGQ